MDIGEIRAEIEKLERGDTNWANIERLSWLYAVHDHMGGEIPVDSVPEIAGEFGQVVSGKNIDSVMQILAEHMSVIKILHPKEYQAVLDRIAEIP